MANETGEGKAGATGAVVQASPSHSETIDTTDAGLHHRGTLHGADPHPHGRDQFSDEQAAPDHGRLTTDAAAWRAAAAARNEYAQAQPLSGSHDTAGHIEHSAIGRVDKVVGNVTVMRNGVAVVLHAGDAVFKSDVIQTGSGSSVGIFFADGTAIHLVANTRMALNAYSYDAGAGANAAAAFSLIDGTFGFVAGKLAGLGDMKITTPVATMSVHEGAIGWAHELTDSETASISTKLGGVAYSFAVTDRGGDSHGLYDLIADGSVVGSINDPHLISYLDQHGNLVSLPLDSSNVGSELAQFLQAGNAVPGALGVHGSGGPIDAPSFPGPVGLNPGPILLSISTGSSFNPGRRPSSLVRACLNRHRRLPRRPQTSSSGTDWATGTRTRSTGTRALRRPRRSTR
jgi:FecR protein